MGLMKNKNMEVIYDRYDIPRAQSLEDVASVIDGIPLANLHPQYVTLIRTCEEFSKARNKRTVDLLAGLDLLLVVATAVGSKVLSPEIAPYAEKSALILFAAFLAYMLYALADAAIHFDPSDDDMNLGTTDFISASIHQRGDRLLEALESTRINVLAAARNVGLDEQNANKITKTVLRHSQSARKNSRKVEKKRKVSEEATRRLADDENAIYEAQERLLGGNNRKRK